VNVKSQNTNEPFKDLIFSPITKKFVAENLIRIALQSKSGIFHLSGEENISYYKFCELLYDELGISKNLINPVDSFSMHIDRFHFPKWSGLGMKITNSQVGISPQPIQDVVRYLCAEQD
jgi:dTDP-4-dehydrorhamnose reductase